MFGVYILFSGLLLLSGSPDALRVLVGDVGADMFATADMMSVLALRQCLAQME